MELVKLHQDHNPCPSMSTNSKFQRRTVQIIVSVSIFSGMLLLLYSSLLVHICFHSFKSFHFAAYFVELQSLIYTPSKNYMFLLCNVILVIIVGCSGLIEAGRSGVAPSGPQTARNDPWFSGHGRDVSNGLTERRRRSRTDAEEKLPMAVKEELLIQTNEVQDQGSELAITVPSHDDYDDDEEDELSRDECLITEPAMQEQPSELRMIIDRAFLDDDDNSGNDGEAHGELSVEELNRKCDEFIKKMKGELDFGNLVAP
ncbi:DYW_deaminase domain-containing protein [Psidium guajava]|nr:DYW_deaminase domain-containing protein [Psidium guajava]